MSQGTTLVVMRQATVTSFFSAVLSLAVTLMAFPPQSDGQQTGTVVAAEIPSLFLYAHKPQKITEIMADMGIILPLQCETDGRIAFLAESFHPAPVPFAIYEVMSASQHTRISADKLSGQLQEIIPMAAFAMNDDCAFVFVKAVTPEEA